MALLRRGTLKLLLGGTDSTHPRLYTNVPTNVFNLHWQYRAATAFHDKVHQNNVKQTLRSEKACVPVSMLKCRQSTLTSWAT